MTSRKSFLPPDHERNISMLAGFLFKRVQGSFGSGDWGDLRQSHFRVIAMVSPDGVTITELAERVGMTKQGCGQFVRTLTASGFLATRPDPSDGRVRLVHRTPEGDRVIQSVRRRTEELEEEWRAQVGARRYRTFRAVLEEIALEPFGS